MSVFFYKDTATTQTYTYPHTLSLHDALPICRPAPITDALSQRSGGEIVPAAGGRAASSVRAARLAPLRRGYLHCGCRDRAPGAQSHRDGEDRTSTRLNSSH